MTRMTFFSLFVVALAYTPVVMAHDRSADSAIYHAASYVVDDIAHHVVPVTYGSYRYNRYNRYGRYNRYNRYNRHRNYRRSYYRNRYHYHGRGYDRYGHRHGYRYSRHRHGY